MKKLSALCLALLLTACGGGDSSRAYPGPLPTPTPPTAPSPVPVVLDAFFSRVLALIGITNEEDEPVTLDDVLVTSPDDTEPVPLT